MIGKHYSIDGVIKLARIHTVLVYSFITGRGKELMPDSCESFYEFEVAEDYANSFSVGNVRYVTEIVSNRLK